MSYDAQWLQSIFDQRLVEAGFAVREEQLAMANFVHTALTKRRHLLAEAGVGTGKTFAYLIPAFAQVMRTKMPVIVATHTIALQEQLVLKDIPAVRELLDLPMQALLAKGKEHYLCPARAMDFASAHPEPNEAEAALMTWSRRTRTGDRQELPNVSEAHWEAVNLGEKRQCHGCRYEATCVTQNTRRRWLGAHGILVTNHHQFFADLALRAQGRAGLFADPAAIILDEAHALEGTAREMLGSSTTLRGLLGAVQASAHQLGAGDERAYRAVMAQADALVETLTKRVNFKASEEATRFGFTSDEPLVAAARRLYDGLGGLSARLGGMRDTPARTRMIERLEDAKAPLRGLFWPERHIAWVEGPKGGARRADSLHTAPRDLDQVLASRLFGRSMPVVMTSATMSVDGDFAYIKRQLGVESALACSVGTPFDHEHQSRLYVAEDLPDPGVDAEAFYAAAIERLKELLEATQGRALVLFTAKSRAAQAAQSLRAWGRFPILTQSRATPELLARFQAEKDSVLLGTGFWEGIDVPGEALSCVVIVKLPFPAEDPLLAAKQQQAREAGEDPFEAVLLPEMLLKLQQGAGRLIRREDDRGVIAILDPRAVTRERYAEAVATSLPPSPRVADLAGVRSFLAGE